VLLRHLVLPDGIAGTGEILKWVAKELGPETYINLMAQYRPANKVSRRYFPELNRRITFKEFREALDAARAAGLHRLDQRVGHFLLEECQPPL